MQEIQVRRVVRAAYAAQPVLMSSIGDSKFLEGIYIYV